MSLDPGSKLLFKQDHALHELTRRALKQAELSLALMACERFQGIFGASCFSCSQGPSVQVLVFLGFKGKLCFP